MRRQGLISDAVEMNLLIARRIAQATGQDLTSAYIDALTKTEQQTGEDLGVFIKRLQSEPKQVRKIRPPINNGGLITLAILTFARQLGCILRVNPFI